MTTTTLERPSDRITKSPELDQFGAFCSELVLHNGQPMVLEDFQRAILSDFFRGTTETLVLCCKKQGKSTCMAALALHSLLVTDEADIIVVAASRDQASILYNQAAGFVRRSPGLKDILVAKGGYREIQWRDKKTPGRIRVLASDDSTADGVLPTLAIVDELHRDKSAGLYGVLRDGLGPRNGRMITISTAGDDELSVLGILRTRAYELPVQGRNGAYKYAASADHSFVMHEWSLDPAEDRDDMSVVKKANPASWQTEEALRRRHDSPSMTKWQWARFACGVWLHGESAWAAGQSAGRRHRH